MLFGFEDEKDCCNAEGLFIRATQKGIMVECHACKQMTSHLGLTLPMKTGTLLYHYIEREKRKQFVPHA